MMELLILHVAMIAMLLVAYLWLRIWEIMVVAIFKLPSVLAYVRHYTYAKMKKVSEETISKIRYEIWETERAEWKINSIPLMIQSEREEELIRLRTQQKKLKIKREAYEKATR